MRHTKLHCLIIILILFISCNNRKPKEKKEKQITVEESSYRLDVDKTKVIWNGYKTNDKIKVVGYFSDFSSDRENKEYSSIEELLDGLEFSIKSSSSVSGDPIRDKNLKDHFAYYASVSEFFFVFPII